MTPLLRELGWDSFFADQLSDEERASASVARVVEEHQRFHKIDDGGAAGVRLAEIAGRMRHGARGERAALFPVVGDWVVFSARPQGAARIERVLARRTKLSRKAAGIENVEQVLCANVDRAFIVASLDDELNERRLERYLVTARAGAVTPVVTLTKLDLCAGSDEAVGRTRALSGEVRVLAVSAVTGEGLPALQEELAPGTTAVFLGPSGAGKSSLINALAGTSLRATGEVRERDRKGRHTTTTRALLRLPTGALVIDTPGIRELEVWHADGEPAATESSFDDVTALAEHCRFRDCQHGVEPGCAVRQAVEQGELASDRYDAFLKLVGERASQDVRATARARAERSRVAKVATRALRARLEDKRPKE